jgi:hypothetical protein
MSAKRFGITAAVLNGVAALAGCSGEGPRDAIAPSSDVVVDAGAPTRSRTGYEYVARRPLAAVALAEARGLPLADARAAMDRLADGLDACVMQEAHGGPPPGGAARVIAQVRGDGAVEGVSVRVDPGSRPAVVALVCLVAPVKLLSFPASDGAARGLAIEALWGAVSPAPQP